MGTGDLQPGESDPELAAFLKRGNQPTGDDDPELLAFEAAQRRRNVIVYLVGGCISAALGGVFAVLALMFKLEHRVLGAGLSLFTFGVACILASWRLSRGAPMTAPEQSVEDADAAAKRTARKLARIGIGGAVLGLAVFAVAMAFDWSGLVPPAIGMFFGGLVCLQRAQSMKPR